MSNERNMGAGFAGFMQAGSAFDRIGGKGILGGNAFDRIGGKGILGGNAFDRIGGKGILGGNAFDALTRRSSSFDALVGRSKVADVFAGQSKTLDMLSGRGGAFNTLTRGSRSLAWLHGGERTRAPGILWESGPLTIRAAGGIGVRSHVTGAVTATDDTANAAPVEEERRRRVEIDTTQLGWIFGAVGMVAASMAPLAEKSPGLYYLALVTGGGWAAWRWKDRADQ